MKISIKQMCKELEQAEFITRKDGTHPTAKEIANYSLTGELGMILVWYDELQIIIIERVSSKWSHYGRIDEN